MNQEKTKRQTFKQVELAVDDTMFAFNAFREKLKICPDVPPQKVGELAFNLAINWLGCKMWDRVEPVEETVETNEFANEMKIYFKRIEDSSRMNPSKTPMQCLEEVRQVVTEALRQVEKQEKGLIS